MSNWTRVQVDARTIARKRSNISGVRALDDGRYDAIVIDATRDEEDVVHVELVLTRGDLKGDVVRVRATGLTEDEVSLLGMPATIDVLDGVPSVRFDE